MEGVWFAYDAASGAPIYQRVKVIDNVEHPDLKPGKPVVVYPASIGGLNYSPASFDPQTGYIYNAAAETAAVFVQQTSSQHQGEALLAGDVYLGLANGDYGQYLRSGWRDYGSVSAIDVATGKQVWKIKTPEPERGGVTTTDSGLAFTGGGDGEPACVRRQDRQGAVDVPDGLPDRGRPVDLLGRRQGVHRHRDRRHRDVVRGRNGRVSGPGLRPRREQRPVGRTEVRPGDHPLDSRTSGRRLCDDRLRVVGARSRLQRRHWHQGR